ncbi:MAG: SDR family NAD(P)-dependent oxidoreductase [Alistipes indistinctus]
MDFTGKVVVITGASSGIGEALVYAFADRGAKVVMGARNSAKLAEIAAQLFTRGIESAFEATDVTREEDCKRLIDKRPFPLSAGSTYRICNAGISMRALLDDFFAALMGCGN